MPVTIHITGFGKFQGVEQNPTTTLINDLPSYFKENPLQENVDVSSFTVLETSGVGSLFAFSELLQKFHVASRSNKEENKVLFVHLGVAANNTKFHLESTAWNTANFRCPDERGWAPSNQTIIPTDGPVENPRTTKLPLDDFAKTLTDEDFTVAVSTDPGRFVCNWIYYNSLYFSSHNDTESLFIHVPPFEVFPEEVQLKFVKRAIELCANSVLNK